MKLFLAAVATTIAAAVLAGLIWLVPTAHRYPLDAGVSYATIHKIDYLSNFWLYFGAISICVPIGIAFSHLLPAAIPFRFRRDARERPRRTPSIPRIRQFLVAGATALVAVAGFTSQFFYSISGSLLRIREPFTAELTDTFHEGELLAPIPSLSSGIDAPKPFLAHGPGMDLLPGLFALHLFPAGHHIVGTRIGAALLTLASFAAFLFASYQVFTFVRPGRTLADLFLCFFGLLLLLLFCEYLGRGSPRRLIFFLQLGLVFRLLRSPRASLAFLIGATLPVGFVYNYAIGIAGILLVLASSLLIRLAHRACRIRYLAAVFSGILVGALGSFALFGSAWISTIGPNIAYWSRFGQILTFTPMFRREWLSRPEWYVYGLLLIVPPALMGELVILDYLNCRTLRVTLERRTAEILLLIICLLESRTFLERADFQHFGFAAPVFVLTSATFAIILAGPAAAVLLRTRKPWNRVFLPVLALALAAIVEYPNVRPRAVFQKIRDVASSIHTPDSQLLRADYAEAIASMKNQVSRQSCFYTLNSEGAWYDLLDVPSCSVFAQLNYARTPEGQARVLSDLRQFRPRIILVNSDFRDGGYDGITLAMHSRPVWNYVLANYQPLRTIGGFRFYELREDSIQKTSEQ